MVDHFETFMKSSLHLKMTNFSNPSRWGASAISKTSPRESKIFSNSKSFNIKKTLSKGFERTTAPQALLSKYHHTQKS